MRGTKVKLFLAIFVTVVMVVSTLGFVYDSGTATATSYLGSSPLATTAPTASSSSSGSGNSNPGLAAVVNSALKDKGITKDLFIPNVNFLPGMQDSHVEPLY